MDIQTRYHHDPVLRALVDTMLGMLMKDAITSHDLARCAVYAAEQHARIGVHQATIILVDQERTR